MNVEVHIKLGVHGPQEKRAMFHRALVEIDNDWPYATRCNAPPGDKAFNCVKCGGRRYHRPRFSASDLKRLATQLGVKVKIKHFALAERCKDSHGTTRFTPISATTDTTKVTEMSVSDQGDGGNITHSHYVADGRGRGPVRPPMFGSFVN